MSDVRKPTGKRRVSRFLLVAVLLLISQILLLTGALIGYDGEFEDNLFIGFSIATIVLVIGSLFAHAQGIKQEKRKAERLAAAALAPEPAVHNAENTQEDPQDGTETLR